MSTCKVDMGAEDVSSIPTPKEEHKLVHLLAKLNNTVARQRQAIGRYHSMNDGLVGCTPEVDAAEAEDLTAGPRGLVHELIEMAEVLHDQCAEFDNQNNRLNQIIADG